MFVGDVLEADTTSAVNVTVIGMTTLSVGGNGRMVVTQARETGTPPSEVENSID